MASSSGLEEENIAVTRLREYLRIKTVHPDPDYETAVSFLERYAVELELECETCEVHPGRTVVVMKLAGSEPSLKSVVLNSHTDVVPVFKEHWKHDPFEAVKEDNGDIYARGAQDMKSTGITHLEAVRKLKSQGKVFRRNIFLTFVPDEEIGGELGMIKFIQTDTFKDLNLGFALDEGLANPTEAYTAFYGERLTWYLNVRCTGNPGHGSRFIENNAADKLRKVINCFLDFRAEQEKKLNSESCFTLGDVTSVNMTMLEGGVQHNVVPTEFVAGFDIRIAPTVDLKSFRKQIEDWCQQAGEGVSCDEIHQFESVQSLTSISKDDPWWSAFTTACEQKKITLKTEIFPAGTDSYYLREAGYPAIGFSPMNKTPILLHDHNEFLNESVFLEGIDIFSSILEELANVKPF